LRGGGGGGRIYLPRLVFLAIAPRGVTGASREKFWDGKYDTWVMRFVRGGQAG
jgi:hypothetical protein